MPQLNIGGFPNTGAGAQGPRAWLDEINRSKLEFYNLRYYGAKGDIDTDDTAAINAAAAAVQGRGGFVCVPYGVYRYTSSLLLANEINFIGEGWADNSGAANRGASCFLKDGNFPGVIVSADNCGMFNMQIDGVPGNGGDGIELRGGRFNGTNLSVTGQGGIGLRIGSASAMVMNANLWRLYNFLAIGNGSHGMYVHDANNAPPNVNAGAAFGLDLRGNGGDGLRFDNAKDNMIHGCGTQQNGGYGFRFAASFAGNGAQGNYVNFAYSEANTTGDVIFDANTSQNKLLGLRSALNDTVINNGAADNLIMGQNGSKVSGAYYRTPMAFSTMRVMSPTISGYWDFLQNDASRALQTIFQGSASSPIIWSISHNTGSAGLIVANANGPFAGRADAPVYGASIAIDASRGNTFTITATNATAFTISNPTNVQQGGQFVAIDIYNNSGGALGAATFGTNYRLAGAWVQPLNGNHRAILFYADPGAVVFREISRSAADQPN